MYTHFSRKLRKDVYQDGEILYTEFIAATLEMRGKVEEKRLAEVGVRILFEIFYSYCTLSFCLKATCTPSTCSRHSILSTTMTPASSRRRSVNLCMGSD